MTKKIISSPGMWRRIGAHAIDLGFILVTAAIVYFSFVFRLSFNAESYDKAQQAAVKAQLDSSLYVKWDSTYVASPADVGSFESVASFSYNTTLANGVNASYSMLDNLHDYYTLNREAYGERKLSEEVFESDVLAIGSPLSNIASIEKNSASHFAITLTDKNAFSTTRDFLLKRYKAAVTEVNDSKLVSTYAEEAASYTRFAVLMLIPTTAGSALLYTLLIPLCLPNGKSLGKLFLHLVVLSKDGYELKKIWLLPRSLSYIVIELLLGVASFGATFLISYTMCMFMKEHRCIHDLLSNSVVAEEETSFWFKDEVDEEEYLARNPENEAY